MTSHCTLQIFYEITSLKHGFLYFDRTEGQSILTCGQQYWSQFSLLSYGQIRLICM